VDQARVPAADPDSSVVRRSRIGRATQGDSLFCFVDDGSLFFAAP